MVFLMTGNKARISVLNTAIHCSTTQCNKMQKEIKGIEIRKEEIKLSRFTEGMIIYIESIKEGWQCS
jgi:hypothetical protein